MHVQAVVNVVVSSEREIVAARAYLAALRGGELPAAAVDESLAGRDVGTTFEDASPRVERFCEVAKAAQPLELVAFNETLELRDRTGERIVGRLSDIHGIEASAHAVDQAWRLVFELARRGWMIVARSAADGDAAAAFYRGWRPGGDVWVAPDLWCSLRWTPLTRNSTWRLTAAGHDILRVRTLAQNRLEITTARLDAVQVVVVLLVCWAILAETRPPAEVIAGGGGW